ncbi:TPA: cell division protein FtsA, partial [Candidatus Sumerlaeota bacterium]|nr:cell division protein FtsA [Candidatus Sumerlaeota bacterium]
MKKTTAKHAGKLQSPQFPLCFVRISRKNIRLLYCCIPVPAPGRSCPNAAFDASFFDDLRRISFLFQRLAPAMFRKRPSHRIITGLDIGTTKVCAIIGKADEDGKLTILGMGSYPSKGLRRGEITEISPTVDAINRATQRAIEVANVHIDDIYVGIAGGHILSVNQEACVDIRRPARGIDEKDRTRAVEKAAATLHLDRNQTLIHKVVQEFQINEGQPTHNPIGLSGSSLKAHVHLVAGCEDQLQNIIRCVKKAGFRQSPHIVLQSLASSMSVLTSHEQELGALLIDIGGGTTDLAYFANGTVRWTGEVAMGGDMITRDIMEVLGCRLNDAENVKKKLGCALPDTVDRDATFPLPQLHDPSELSTHKEHTLAEIIECRLEEIFEMALAQVTEAGFKDR